MTTTSPLSERPLATILAGLDGTGEAWLPLLAGPEARSLGIDLVGVIDADPERATVALGRHGLSLVVHERISDALATGPDLLVDCTTPNARLSLAREALLSGCHVLIVGLLAADEITAAQLIGASSRVDGQLAVAQHSRYQPGVRQLRDLVRAGGLGRPQTLLTDLHMSPRLDGLRAGKRHVFLREMAVHLFDAGRCILGADALTVTCLERTPENQPVASGPEIHASFEMSDGSLFVVHGTWSDPGPPSSWNGAWRMTLSEGAARWDGEGAALAWRSAQGDARGLLLPAVPHPLPPPSAMRSDRLACVEDLLTALRAGRAPETHARDGAQSLAMVLAAIRSAENGGLREPVRRLGDLSDASGLRSRLRVPLRES